LGKADIKEMARFDALTDNLQRDVFFKLSFAELALNKVI